MGSLRDKPCGDGRWIYHRGAQELIHQFLLRRLRGAAQQDVRTAERHSHHPHNGQDCRCGMDVDRGIGVLSGMHRQRVPERYHCPIGDSEPEGGYYRYGRQP